MRIAICLPTGDAVKTDFAFSMWNLVRNVRHHDLDVLNVRSSHLAASRYGLVREALNRAAEAVMFVDCDLAFPVDALDRLVAHDVPFVGATYVSRYPPHPVIGQSLDEPIGEGATGLRRMLYMPVGFSLTRTEVYSKVPRPWYPATYDPETDDHVAEDYGFCRGLRDAGYDAWCDLDLSHELAHNGGTSYMWGMA